jgi:hypothetical protein
MGLGTARNRVLKLSHSLPVRVAQLNWSGRHSVSYSSAPSRRGRKPSPLLSTAIELLSWAGAQAGFSVEEMIEMLNAGVSMGALLDMISYSLSHEALEFTQERQRSPLSPVPVRIRARWK